MPFTDARVFAPYINAGNPREIALALKQLASFIDNPIADLKITPGVATASPRTVTLQVRDRVGAPWNGRWWIVLMFGSGEWDTSAGYTIVPTSGHVAIIVVPGQILVCLTNDDGSFVLTVAPSDFFLTGAVFARAQSSGEVAVT